MKNSIRERAKKVPKRIKIKVALTVWWLTLRQYFVITSAEMKRETNLKTINK